MQNNMYLVSVWHLVLGTHYIERSDGDNRFYVFQVYELYIGQQ